MVSTNVSFSRGDNDRLGKSIAKAVGSNKSSDAFSGSSDTSKTGGVDTAAILNSIKEKAQVQVGKKELKAGKFTDAFDALSDLKSISSNLSSAMKTIKPTGGAGIFNSFAATGAPAGVTITPAAGATASSHTMSVASVASKQTIVIQNKDAAGNPVAFLKDAADVVGVASGGVGMFTTGRSFHIYTNSDNNGVASATIPIPASPYTLQQLATLINTKASAILTATVVSDPVTVPATPGAGDRLVLTSVNAGTAGSFYIDDREITDQTHAIGGAVLGTSPINNLSVTTSYDAVKSIDIYSRYGNSFTSATAMAADGDEDLSFQIGSWNIGMGFVNFEVASDVSSLNGIVRCINAHRNATGVTAQVVSDTAGIGFIIRVTASHGTPLNYTPESTLAFFNPIGTTATATQIRPSTASDTSITVDGVRYNAGGDLTIATTNNADIASITVSAPTPLTTFSITQDVEKLTSAITTLVDTINEAQQFIFQQRDEDAPLLSNNTLNQVTSMINNLVSNSTDVMSLSRMGITWTDYTPTSAEKKDGMVPARYLSINTTTLNNMITSNFDDVKGFFVGTFSNATTLTASATVSSMNKILSFSQFDLEVTPGPVPTARAINYNGGAITALNVISLGGNKALIQGAPGGDFEGLSINYTYTAGNLLAGAPADTIPAIKVYNGASLKLSTALTLYLDVYGPLEKAITDKKNKIIANSKETKSILDKRDKKLAQAQARINKIRIQTIMLESLKKSLERNKN